MTTLKRRFEEARERINAHNKMHKDENEIPGNKVIAKETIEGEQIMNVNARDCPVAALSADKLTDFFEKNATSLFAAWKLSKIAAFCAEDGTLLPNSQLTVEEMKNDGETRFGLVDHLIWRARCLVVGKDRTQNKEPLYDYDSSVFGDALAIERQCLLTIFEIFAIKYRKLQYESDKFVNLAMYLNLSNGSLDFTTNMAHFLEEKFQDEANFRLIYTTHDLGVVFALKDQFQRLSDWDDVSQEEVERVYSLLCLRYKFILAEITACSFSSLMTRKSRNHVKTIRGVSFCGKPIWKYLESKFCTQINRANGVLLCYDYENNVFEDHALMEEKKTSFILVFDNSKD